MGTEGAINIVQVTQPWFIQQNLVRVYLGLKIQMYETVEVILFRGFLASIMVVGESSKKN